MKILDKIKNIFFEEVEEEDEQEELPQSFAKKVEIPKKTHEPFIRKELNDEKEDIKKEEKTNNIIEEENEILEEKKVEEKSEEKEFPMMFDESDFLEDKEETLVTNEKKNFNEPLYSTREERRNNAEKELYHGEKEVSYVESVTNKPTYMHTKAIYEKKNVSNFRPSPIISPVYGILDKNYHKEEVITKRETRITSTFAKPDLDSIRNKAFGNDEKVVTKEEKVEKKETNETKIYDVNNNKPQVNRVTLADADEYYNDLGLAYNVDYSDASRKNTKSVKYNPKEKKKDASNDNLFDLVDSMYNKEE